MTEAFRVDDLLLHEQITELHCVPEHGVAAGVLERIDAGGDTTHSAIWGFALDGSTPPRQMTSGTARDSCPRWSPDGTQLAFISTREGGLEQIHVMPSDGGEARPLTHLVNGLMTMAWRPQGDQFLAIASINVNPDDRGGRPDGNTDRPADAPQLVWRLPYKQDGGGYHLDREFHLFTIDAKSGDSRQFTDGPFDVKSAAWSPDGRHIAHARSRQGRDAHCTDIWLVDADGGGERRLTHDQPTAQSPIWSPDGRYIVYSGNVDSGDAQVRLWCIDMQSGEVGPLGDESIEVVPLETMVWSKDGSQLAFIVAHQGTQQVALIDVPGGRLQRTVTGERQVTALSATHERLVYCALSANRPDTVYSADWGGGQERRLTHFNRWFDERTPLQVQRRSFEVPDGEGGHERIEGWLVQAQGASGAAPLLVDVHGGPASYALLSFAWRAYWPVLCARGWRVLALNPVGSGSYGREFASRLRGRWGELDLPQHLAAIDALQREGLADERLAITGKSYGGYLAAWAIGQSARFRAAVVSAPVDNLESHYGTSDSGYYADPYAMSGKPAINRATSAQLSPMKYVEKARTPTLFLQGTDDQRCPRNQSEELFVTLMRAGSTPTELVLYPGGSHHCFETGKPSHRVDAVRRLVDWLERWIDQPVPPAAHARDDRKGAPPEGKA